MVILRPTVVYGPFGLHTTRTVAAIREGRAVLVNGGMGICNCLFVDNLVEAMLLAAERDRAAGEVFRISDGRPVTWKQFIEAHARALGDTYLPLPEITVAEISAARKELRRRSSSVKGILRVLHDPYVRSALRSIPVVDRTTSIARRVLPTFLRRALRDKLLSRNGGSIVDAGGVTQAQPLPSPNYVNLVTETVEVSVEKAKQVLGYDPAIDFAQGMEITTAWIKWARL